MKTDYKWLVCQAHTSAECWSTLALMLQVTPELECIWRKSLLAFNCATQVADVRELQVRCPMRVVEVDETVHATRYFEIQVLNPLISDTEWRVVSAESAEFMFKEFKELNLEFGISHLEIRPPVDNLYRVRACTAAKHVNDDIYGLEDLQPMLEKLFTCQPTLV